MSNPGPGAQPVVVYVDGDPVSALNPLPTSGGGGGGGTVDQGAANGDAAKGWSVRLTDGSAFVVPAKTGQLPSALGATTAASSLAVGIATDQLSTLATAAKQPALGTAGTPSADVLSVQGVVGGTAVKTDGSAVTQPISAASLPLPTGAATEATLSLLTLAQNSTTGGQSGPLMMGAVTTNAPTYVNNRTQPFSLDTSGGMRVAGYNTPATAQANPTNAVPTQAFLMVWNGSTWDRLLSEGITGDGDNAPSAGTVSAETYNMGFNGATWDRIRVGGDNSTNPTVGKQYVLPARANAAAPSWTEAAAVPLSITLAGDARAISKITDGTNTAAVKAASTAAATTDPAAVVALSPNAPALTITMSSKSSSATSATLLASNTARKGATFYNDDVNPLFLRTDGSAATTSIGGYTVKIVSGAYYELPKGANGGIYTGAITGIWSAAGSSGVSISEST